jgi:hypothetical protein
MLGRHHAVAQRLHRGDHHDGVIAQEAPERLITHESLLLLEGNGVNRQGCLVDIATDNALESLPVRWGLRHTGKEALQIIVQQVTLVGIRRDHQQGYARLDKQACQEVSLRAGSETLYREPWPLQCGMLQLKISKELYHLFDSTSELKDRQIHGHHHPTNNRPEEHHE